MKKISCLIISCLLFLLSAGQETILSGIISDPEGKPIRYASVYLDKGKIGTLSDIGGNYRIEGIPKGEYVLNVSVVGYEEQKIPVSITAEKMYTFNISLSERLTHLSEVTIMTGGESGVSDIPGSVHYISARELKKYNHTDIHKVLSSIPGVYIQEEDGFGLRPNIGLRGSGSERSSKITIMEDGILMAPAPYSAPSAYYFPTAGRMEGIEILKGSSQIKYGPYTTGGAINLLSTSIPEDFSARLDLSTGTFSSHKLHAFAGNSHKHLSYSLETYLLGSQGFKELDQNDNTGFDKKDYLAKIKLHSKRTAKVYQSLDLKLGRSKERSNETYLGLTDDDFEETPYMRYAASANDVMIASQNQYSLSYNVRFSSRFQLKTTMYGTDFKRNWYKLDKVVDDSGQINKLDAVLSDPENFESAYSILTGESETDLHALLVKANNRSYKSRGAQMTAAMDFSSGEIKHHVDIGIRYHTDEVDRFQWVDEYSISEGLMELREAGVPGTESNRVTSAKALAIYSAYRFKYEKLTIIPGLRYEFIEMHRIDYGKSDPAREGTDISHTDNNINVFAPGISLDYKFGRTVSAFAGLHKGFAPAGATEGAKAEMNLNYEAGVRYQKAAFNSKLVLFFSDYSNLLGADLASSGGTGSGELFNGGEVDVKGIEFELMYDPLYKSNSSLHLPLRISYTYTDARFNNSFESEFEAWGDVEEGDKLPYLASNQLSFSAGLESYRFKIFITSKYVSAMRTQASQGKILKHESTDAKVITDLSLHFRVHKNINFYTTVQNLSNSAYIVSRRPAGVRPGMPRNFTLGLKASF